MWWILGIGILILAIRVLLSWPFSIKFAINTDAYGRNWIVKTKGPFRKSREAYKEGNLDLTEYFEGFDRLLLVYVKNLYQSLLSSSLKRTKAAKTPRTDFWENVFLRSLRFKRVNVEMGIKETVAGEAVFLFGIVAAILYPVFGYIHANNKGFVPEISFKKDLSGFAFSCIITFTLGQLIHEAGKRYWALWKESKYAR